MQINNSHPLGYSRLLSGNRYQGQSKASSSTITIFDTYRKVFTNDLTKQVYPSFITFRYSSKQSRIIVLLNSYRVTYCRTYNFRVTFFFCPIKSQSRTKSPIAEKALLENCMFGSKSHGIKTTR